MVHPLLERTRRKEENVSTFRFTQVSACVCVNVRVIITIVIKYRHVEMARDSWRHLAAALTKSKLTVA